MGISDDARDAGHGDDAGHAGPAWGGGDAAAGASPGVAGAVLR